MAAGRWLGELAELSVRRSHGGVEGVLRVEVNGDPRQVAEGSTVSSLLGELGLHPRGVAVEYNGEILKRASYPDTRLAQGDRLEIVRFVQGGRPDSLSFGDRVVIVPVGPGPLAQLVEQQTLNLRVRGSIPWRLTIFPPRNHTLPPQEAGGLAAKVAELVYALDLGSSPGKPGWGFESPLSHHRLMNLNRIKIG